MLDRQAGVAQRSKLAIQSLGKSAEARVVLVGIRRSGTRGMPGTKELVVWQTVDESLDASLLTCSETHQAWLEGHVQGGGRRQAPALQRAARLANGVHFGVLGGALAHLSTVEASLHSHNGALDER